MCIDIVVRLKEFMKHVGLPSTQFADYAKIARPTISQLLNGRNRKVSNELIAKLHDAFPDLNILWLMFGDGEMINKKNAGTAASVQSLFTQPQERQVPDQGMYQNQQPIEIQQAPQSKQWTDDTADSVDDNEIYDAHERVPSQSVHIPVTPNTEMVKRIKSIMVFYTDSSFEIFTPSDI